MKFVVGCMLTTFGIFWGAEGLLVDWPAGDATIVVILAGVVLTSVVAVRMLAVMAPKAVHATTR